MQSLLNIYQLSIEGARATYEILCTDRQKGVRLKERLEGFGAVNLAAPRTRQLERRYQFHHSRSNKDSLKAKDGLHQAITEIQRNNPRTPTSA